MVDNCSNVPSSKSSLQSETNNSDNSTNHFFEVTLAPQELKPSSQLNDEPGIKEEYSSDDEVNLQNPDTYDLDNEFTSSEEDFLGFDVPAIPAATMKRGPERSRKVLTGRPGRPEKQYNMKSVENIPEH